MLIKNELKKETKKKSGVYVISNNIDNRVYIGSAVNFYNRLKIHSQDLTKKKHANPHLQNFVNKYGIESLFFKILFICPKEYCIKMEQWCLDSTIEKFNIRTKAESNFGIEVKESTRQKLREINRGKKLSQETKDKLSEQAKGRKADPASIKKGADKRRGMKRNPLAIEKTRLANIGSKRTQEQKENISKSLIGKKLSDLHKSKIGSFFKGISLSEEHKKKISLSHKNNMSNREKQSKRLQGESCPFAKLCEENIRFIRQALREKTFNGRQLAKMFKVDENTISSIKLYKLWKHVV